jgi:purine-binding chemotaxis protein CheW
MEEKDYTQRTCIVVVEVLMQGSKKFMGVIVDTVSEVVAVHPEDIEQTIGAEGYYKEEFLEGIAKVKGKVVILLNVEKILDSQELFLLKK